MTEKLQALKLQGMIEGLEHISAGLTDAAMIRPISIADARLTRSETFDRYSFCGAGLEGNVHAKDQEIKKVLRLRFDGRGLPLGNYLHSASRRKSNARDDPRRTEPSLGPENVPLVVET